MFLKEFFSRPIDATPDTKSSGIGETFLDDLFWFIIDHDKLFKDYIFPIAKKLKAMEKCSEDMIYKLFMPLVIKGCKEFFEEREMTGYPSKKFPEELRKGLCKQLYEHFMEDIKKDKYKLGI